MEPSMAFFIPLTYVTFFQFNSVTSSMLFTKNSKLLNKRKQKFLYMPGGQEKTPLKVKNGIILLLSSNWKQIRKNWFNA